AEAKDAEIRLGFRGQAPHAMAALRVSGGQTVLVNLQQPEQVIALERPGPRKALAGSVWIVRLEVGHGLVQVKAWRHEESEPRHWLGTRYNGALLWQPVRLVVQAGSQAAAILDSLVIKGTAPPTALTQEQKQKAQRANVLFKVMA